MKMYNQPITEIAALETERMMDSITMSAGPGGGGKTDAPKRSGDGDIID